MSEPVPKSLIVLHFFKILQLIEVPSVILTTTLLKIKPLF